MTDHPHPVDVHVGKRLRLRRSILGMSQESIGKAIGVTFQQIQKYERGINRMGASRLYDFGRALNVPISYFYEGYGDYVPMQAGELSAAEPESMKFEHEDINSRETLEVMRAYYRIKNPAVRKRIMELIRAFAEDSAEEKPKAS
jgi:transcriptional regulator with XRE-family HTH domain